MICIWHGRIIPLEIMLIDRRPRVHTLLSVFLVRDEKKEKQKQRVRKRSRKRKQLTVHYFSKRERERRRKKERERERNCTFLA